MKHDIYVPSNILNFKCNMCGDCCKKPWTIYVAKNEYKYIKELYRKKSLNKIFNESFVIVNKESIGKYARLENGCGQCALLSQTNMCTKQLEFGANALTGTCFNYPKGVITTPRGVEVFMYYSCKTALHTLDTNEPIKVLKNPTKFLIRYTETQKLNTLTEELKEFYFLIEEFILNVFQTRSLTIEERLLVLSFIVDKTASLNLKSNNMGELLKVLEKAQLILENKELLTRVKNVEPNYIFQVAYILSTLDTNSNKLELIKETIIDINEMLKLDNYKDDIYKITNTYVQNYEKYYKNYEKDIEYILENYLCQFIFRKEFTKTFLNGFFVTSFYFALVRFFSIYLCIKYDKVLGKDIVLEAIRICENGFAHSYSINDAFAQIIKEKRIDVPSTIQLFKM